MKKLAYNWRIIGIKLVYDSGDREDDEPILCTNTDKKYQLPCHGIHENLERNSLGSTIQ